MPKGIKGFQKGNKVNLGRRCPEKRKKEMSLLMKGRTLSKDHRKKIGDAQRMEKGNNWRGGKKLQDGYIFIKIPSHPNSCFHGYVAKHRLIMEKHLGRYLISKEIVHHKGIKYPIGSIENKQDNRIKNLQLVSRGEHLNLHKKINKSTKILP